MWDIIMNPIVIIFVVYWTVAILCGAFREEDSTMGSD